MTTGTHEIALDRLARLAPSVFAEARHESRSAKYAYYPTAEIVRAMSGEGWAPVAVTEARTRIADRKGFTKHGVRFARRDDLAKTDRAVGERRVEALVVNSHDGTSAFKIHAGIFRLVCTNGLVVSDDDFGCITVPHKGNQAAQVVEASLEVVRRIPEIESRVDALRALPLKAGERQAFAEAAAIVRWGDLEQAPVPAERLLTPKRLDDVGEDAWTTLNVVQENVIVGGLSSHRGGRKLTTRSVGGIDQNTLVNKALWHLMGKLAASR